MIQGGFTHTEAGQPGANQHFGPNNNFELDQASLFYGGAIWQEQGLGAFIQGTYDGVARQFTWDNLDVRLARQTELFGQDLTYGFTLNNNPSVQDVWNTTPAWRFPFFSSGLAPFPGAAAMIEGGFGQQVLGLGGYLWWNHMVYAEISGYRTLSISTARARRALDGYQQLRRHRTLLAPRTRAELGSALSRAWHLRHVCGSESRTHNQLRHRQDHGRRLRRAVSVQREPAQRRGPAQLHPRVRQPACDVRARGVIEYARASRHVPGEGELFL